MIEQTAFEELITSIRDHEGYRKFMYVCPSGYNTIGYGLNLDAGIDRQLADYILGHQVTRIEDRCYKELTWFKSLESRRKAVVVEMIYNLGWDGFSKFKRTIEYIKSGDYILAGEEMLDSRWAKQVGKRAITLSDKMKEG